MSPVQTRAACCPLIPNSFKIILTALAVAVLVIAWDGGLFRGNLFAQTHSTNTHIRSDNLDTTMPLRKDMSTCISNLTSPAWASIRPSLHPDPASVTCLDWHGQNSEDW